ncbi:Poly-beta-1,6-N-acetyl-D-glucosamine N-deacetylase precursor [Clostridium liquoris]|uniref:Poly-beta-1,6-N-acetyl-D-glucosamine N-deacetylase n=2 Tax=Clostridium liquoris TaxID=1289519 RepID=A0A2T0B4A7_9CLOT|nr:Poly-beta-1,6-N-acetyl-D-glucosamine N-deacetylase precursor [Clostridium liquoris]
MKVFKRILIFILITLIIKPCECKAMRDDKITVLMYHSVGYEKNNGLRMSEEQFRKQMKYIKDNGYTALTLDELYSYFIENKPIPKKSLVITFDDGYLDNYKYAYPILKEFNLKATIFVIADNIDKDNRSMNSGQLKELQSNGIDIQSHTLKHEELNKLSYELQLKTLKESKQVMENILDKKVNYIAYPYGKYNEDTIRAAKDAGYIMGFVTGGRVAKKDDGIYTVHRIGVVAGDGMDVFMGRLHQ